MPEALVPGDVEQYTSGRLPQNDPETVRALDAALARVRRWCGWHVSPVKTETLTIDRRSYSSLLILPTLKIVTLNSVTVDGVAVDPANVLMSGEAPGVLSTKSGYPWSYRFDSGFGQIQVNLTHGYTAAEAADFREAVLQLIDQASLNVGTGATGPVTDKTVDDAELHWSAMTDRLPGAIAKNPMNESILYQFRILPIA